MNPLNSDTTKELTACYPHDSHDTDDRRIDWNEAGLDLFQHDANYRQDHDPDVQLIPPATQTRHSVCLQRLLYWISCTAIQPRQTHKFWSECWNTEAVSYEPIISNSHYNPSWFSCSSLIKCVRNIHRIDLEWQTFKTANKPDWNPLINQSINKSINQSISVSSLFFRSRLEVKLSQLPHTSRD